MEKNISELDGDKLRDLSVLLSIDSKSLLLEMFCVELKVNIENIKKVPTKNYERGIYIIKMCKNNKNMTIENIVNMLETCGEEIFADEISSIIRVVKK